MSYVKLVFFSLFIFSCSTQTLSEHSSLNAKEEITIKPKRIPRKSILPITVGDIIYNTSMNEIIATDLLNNDVLWIKKIYAVVYNEKLEKDVQDVYIDSISYSDNTLIIHNELGQTYFLDLNTQLVYPSSNTNNIIIHEGYQLTISQSLKTEFDFYNASDSSLVLVSKDQCIEQGLLLIDSAKSINLKLSDGNFFTLKKDVPDEQFFGYNFIHFDIKRNIYVLWESWLEAGHPIMVNASTGKITQIMGESFCTNQNQEITVNYADDIGAGWTPNGIQFLERNNNGFEVILEFSPDLIINENWGPTAINWKNDSTILIECVEHNVKGGYLTLYKKLQFKKQ